MFSSADLVTAAKARFGDAQLRSRMRGATSDANANVELTKIAAAVIGRVQDAATPQVGWPLPGSWPEGSLDDDGVTNISGVLYANKWPKTLYQKALDLFNWWTVSGHEATSDNQRRVGKMAEDWFDSVETGGAGLGLAVLSEPSGPVPIAARDRDGLSLLPGVPDQENVLDTFIGRAWDG